MSDAAVVCAFPGQGSLAPGAGVPWRDHPAFKVVHEVSEACGLDVARLVTDAGEVELTSTRNAQLGTYALSLAVLDAAAIAPSASFMLGHSLGEYTALVAAGVLSREDGARLVDARGTAMLLAATAAPGTLVAMIGGDLEVAGAACATISDLYVANLNGPGQIVLGGSEPAVAEVAQRARELGFRRAIPLKVGGAFHTPHMTAARPALDAALGAATFEEGTATVLANVDGAAHRDPDEWRSLLSRQLTEPVDWAACVGSLPSGALVVELGPGGVLTGLTRRIRDDVHCLSVETPAELDQLVGLR